MPPDPPLLLQASALSAGYGTRIVLRNATIHLHAGAWLGLLGANGSGKSTLLRAITGQIPLLAGSIQIAGIDLACAPERARAAFGYAVDPAELPMGLTGRQYLAMVASIRFCAATDWPHPDLPGLLALAPWLDHRIAACSLGTRAKISIAAALLGAPPLLILDEALNGLDPLITIRVRRLLSGMVATGRHAVILSTHILEQVAADATQVILLEDGAIAHRWDAEALDAARRIPGGMEEAFLRALESV